MAIPRGPLTDAVIALNVAVFLLGWLLGQDDTMRLMGGFIAARASGEDLAVIALPVWLTPLSSAFLHGDIIHLLFNMLLLLFCGRFVELALGARQWAMLYIAAAYGAALFQWAIDPSATTLVIGASGAMSGTIAAYMLLYARDKGKPWGPLPARWARMAALLLMWVLINAAMELGGMLGQSVAVGSHIGGFVAGLVLARPLLHLRWRRA